MISNGSFKRSKSLLGPFWADFIVGPVLKHALAHACNCVGAHFCWHQIDQPPFWQSAQYYKYPKRTHIEYALQHPGREGKKETCEKLENLRRHCFNTQASREMT